MTGGVTLKLTCDHDALIQDLTVHPADLGVPVGGLVLNTSRTRRRTQVGTCTSRWARVGPGRPSAPILQVRRWVARTGRRRGRQASAPAPPRPCPPRARPRTVRARSSHRRAYAIAIAVTSRIFGAASVVTAAFQRSAEAGGAALNVLNFYRWNLSRRRQPFGARVDAANVSRRQRDPHHA